MMDSSRIEDLLQQYTTQIHNLQEELRNPTTNSPMPTEISRVAVRLPPFWAERPVLWFAQAEAQFSLAGVNNEKTKFYHVVSQLDHRYATEVEDIITSPPEKDPYSVLKAKLVTRLSPSREQRIRQFLTLEMDDRKPSPFLRQLRILAPDVSDDFLRSIWSSRLPPNLRAILACQPEGDLNAAGRCADRIIEAAPQSALASVVPLADSNTPTQQIEDLSRQVAALSTELTHLRSNYKNLRPKNRTQRLGNRSPSREDATSTLCRYHRRYGAQARKCTQPCSYSQQEKLTQRTSAVAHVCTQINGRFFITDRISKRRFLIDTSQTSPYILASSFHGAENVSTTTSARLPAPPSLLMDGCPSNSTWD
jgi:hypothetical protein